MQDTRVETCCNKVSGTVHSFFKAANTAIGPTKAATAAAAIFALGGYAPKLDLTLLFKLLFGMELADIFIMGALFLFADAAPDFFALIVGCGLAAYGCWIAFRDSPEAAGTIPQSLFSLAFYGAALLVIAKLSRDVNTLQKVTIAKGEAQRQVAAHRQAAASCAEEGSSLNSATTSAAIIGSNPGSTEEEDPNLAVDIEAIEAQKKGEKTIKRLSRREKKLQSFIARQSELYWNIGNGFAKTVMTGSIAVAPIVGLGGSTNKLAVVNTTSGTASCEANIRSPECALGAGAAALAAAYLTGEALFKSYRNEGIVHRMVSCGSKFWQKCLPPGVVRQHSKVAEEERKLLVNT